MQRTLFQKLQLYTFGHLEDQADPASMGRHLHAIRVCQLNAIDSYAPVRRRFEAGMIRSSVDFPAPDVVNRNG